MDGHDRPLAAFRQIAASQARVLPPRNEPNPA